MTQWHEPHQIVNALNYCSLMQITNKIVCPSGDRRNPRMNVVFSPASGSCCSLQARSQNGLTDQSKKTPPQQPQEICRPPQCFTSHERIAASSPRLESESTAADQSPGHAPDLAIWKSRNAEIDMHTRRLDGLLKRIRERQDLWCK